VLVDEVIAQARLHFDVTIEEIAITREDVFFKMPAVLAGAAA
jgi:4-hydroxy-3-methylbut-2-enyl diphosphate reductase